MPNYSYADCLEKAYQINWTIDEVIANQQFGRSRRWLPTSLSGADDVAWLSEDEKLKLTHVEMGAYAHIVAYVEEFIAPQMASLALGQKIDHRDAFDALTTFASERGTGRGHRRSHRTGCRGRWADPEANRLGCAKLRDIHWSGPDR